MFDFFKNRKALRDARTEIGVVLHRQIRDAIRQDEHSASEKLSTSFSVGYISWIIKAGFSWRGFDDDSILEKHLKHICDGVIPNRLYDIFQRQLDALEIAHGMKDQASKIKGTNVSPAEVVELFELGSEVGLYDGMHLSEHTCNFKNYLLGQPLIYKSVRKE